MGKISMKYLAILSLLLLCGCPHADTEDFAKTKPKNEDLVGKYVLNAETLKWVRGKGNYPKVETSIELSKDGSFQMVNMPDWWFEPFGDPKGGFDSGVGKWSVLQDQEWWSVCLCFKDTKDFSAKHRCSGWFTIGAQIKGQSVPYRLWFHVGDPDQGEGMIFEKIAGGS